MPNVPSGGNPAAVLAQDARPMTAAATQSQGQMAPQISAGTLAALGVNADDPIIKAMMGSTVGNATMPISDPTDPRLGVNQSRLILDGIKNDDSTKNGNSIADDYYKNMDDSRSLNEVADDLRKKSFQGVSAQYLREQLEKIASQGSGRINYAQAGSILENAQSTTGSTPTARLGNFLNRVFWNGTAQPDLGHGRQIDDDAVNNSIKEITSGLVSASHTEHLRRMDAMGQIAAAENAYQAAQVQMASANQAAASGDQRVFSMLPGLKAQLAQAKNSLKVIQALGLKDTQKPVTDNSDSNAADQLASAARALYKVGS